ncbi:MAG: hypothetical protein AAGG75_25545 [Bacteroidota bacterium]
MNFDIITTVFLAFVGYLITYLYDKRQHSRSESLALVNQRLEKFYGPLYFSTIAGKTSYETLLKKIGRDKVNDNPSNSELKEWRDWVVNIFMPINIRQRDIIYENAFLVMEDKTPECLVNFVKHVSELEVIAYKWSRNDFSEHFPISDYPRDMEKYFVDSYVRLKNEQNELIGRK